MKKFKDQLGKKRERAHEKDSEREARSLGAKVGAHEVDAGVLRKPLTAEKSQKIDFATLGDHPTVDADTNERAHARNSAPDASPDGPPPGAASRGSREPQPTPAP